MKFPKNVDAMILSIGLTSTFFAGTLVALIPGETWIPWWAVLICMAIVLIVGLSIIFSKLTLVFVHVSDEGIKYTYFKKILQEIKWEEINNVTVTTMA